MSSIAFEHITKRYADGFEAVRDMNLEIADGEFMVLLGPSGSGKSTALRMVAGLEDITDGVLKIGGEVVNQRAPKDRDIAMVFQSYALYPHMTVRENMSFALKLAKVPRAQIDAKVNEAARALDLERHLDRKPAHLSGGQRQRVAMGRAIVRDPKVFLMDEPLSNLDAKLRLQTRTEISRIQRQLGTTTIYVTHDQVEALTLADRLAVMRDGRLQQVAAPNEVYEHPDNIFVAGFIGSPSMNFLSGRFGDGLLHTAIGDLTISDALRRRLGPARRGDAEVIVGIRPEHLEDAAFVGDPSRGHTFTVQVDVLESLGAERYVHFTVDGDRAAVEPEQLGQETATTEFGRSRPGIPLIARVGASSRARQGEAVQLWVDTTQLHLFDPESGRNLVAAEGVPMATRASSAAA